MLKIEKDYLNEYGEIPNDMCSRIDWLLDNVNLKRQKKTVTGEIDRILNIKWKHISYTIYLLPKATPRPRSGKSGIFYVKGAKDNKKIFEDFMKDQTFDIITTPAKFDCTSYFPIPSSMNGVEKICAELGLIRPISKPDWDNVAKAYCDMCQGFLLYDDSLIVEGTSRKFYSIKPRIEIRISYMECPDSTYNKNKIKKGR